VATGFGVAWYQAPEGGQDDPWPALIGQLPRREKYKLATVAFSAVSLALYTSGAIVLVMMNPKRKRLEQLLNGHANISGDRQRLAFQPFLDGGFGGTVNILF
jgi:hypothetical protein